MKSLLSFRRSALAFAFASALCASAPAPAQTSNPGGGSSAGVTSVATDSSLTGGPCTSTCTLAVNKAAVLVPNEITGYLPSSMAGTNTTAAMTIAPGTAVDSTAALLVSFASSKSWAVSNGNAANGYQGGTTLPNSTAIHMFDCHGTSGDTSFASTSENAPTCPTGYTANFRRIFSFETNSSGAPLQFTADEIGGGAMMAYLSTPTTDINGATLTTASRTLYSMNVPNGIKVEWMGNVTSQTTTGVWITSPDEPDVAAGASSAIPNFDELNVSSSYILTPPSRRRTITNTSGQIGLRSVNAVVGSAYTTGWIDARRN